MARNETGGDKSGGSEIAVLKSPVPLYYDTQIACLHDQTKVAFLEGRLLSSQSKQSEKFSKPSNWLEKSHFCFIM